jgi:tetratricopeptide (TPR) repeat protein
MGDINRRLGRLDQAMSHYEQAKAMVLEHAGFLPEVYRRIAQIQIALGDVDGAAENAEKAVAITGRDDWATVASTRMALGQVREAQGRIEEAERLLIEAIDVISRLDFNAFEEELALAEFLLHRGRTDDAQEWIDKAKADAARLGQESPLIPYVAARIAAAADAARNS